MLPLDESLFLSLMPFPYLFPSVNLQMSSFDCMLLAQYITLPTLEGSGQDWGFDFRTLALL